MVESEAFDYVREWAVRYVKHRDIAAKKVSEIKGTDYGFRALNNDGTSMDCVVQLALKGVNPEFIAAAKNTLVITLSNDENIREVYAMWDKLAINSSLLIVFANPFSATEEKWVLKPYFHNKVCDKASLLQGLKAMAELVEPIGEETLTLKVRRVVGVEAKSEADAQ